MENLIDKILIWSEEKKLNTTDKDGLFKQTLKVVEEVGEVAQAINKENYKDLEEEIGDIVISTTILAQRAGLDIRECTKLAYDKIKDREGVTKDGVFIKEDDL